MHKKFAFATKIELPPKLARVEGCRRKDVVIQTVRFALASLFYVEGATIASIAASEWAVRNPTHRRHEFYVYRIEGLFRAVKLI